MSRDAEIKFKLQFDENQVPEKIEWQASDSDEGGSSKASMIALWDEKERNTLRIDLWTKEMDMDEMKIFTFQNVMTLADTYARATNDNVGAKKLQEMMMSWGEETGIISRD